MDDLSLAKNLLEEDGVKPIISGFTYLAEAILLFEGNKNISRSGGLYEKIGLKYGKTWECIDRSIGRAIKSRENYDKKTDIPKYYIYRKNKEFNMRKGR